MANTTNTADSTGIKRGKIKHNGYSSAKLHAKRVRKRKEAEARQSEHDKLSIRQKLQLAMDVNRRGESKREIARLQGLLKRNPEPVKKTPATPLLKLSPIVPPPAVTVAEEPPKRQSKSKVVKAAKTKAASKRVKKTKEVSAE